MSMYWRNRSVAQVAAKHVLAGTDRRRTHLLVQCTKILSTIIMLASMAFGSAQSSLAANHAQPNVVFFLIDDLGWEDVGFMGSTFYRTPRIDQLAANGVVFTNAYSNGPNCAPTRAALMSGQYTPRTGVFTVGRSDRGPVDARRLLVPPATNNLSLSTVTLGEAFKSAGYATAYIGKWHLGNGPGHGPKQQGFDINIGGSAQGGPNKNGYFSPYNNLPNLSPGPPGEYLTDRLTDEALDFIDANADRPFFLFLSHYAVHTPLQAKSQLVSRYSAIPLHERQGRPKYAAMVESVDQSVGRIVDRLDELALSKDTIVVLTSDNGGHGNVTRMPSLRGAKGTLYEGGIRVPTFVYWPDVAPAGLRVDHLVASIDFYPTLLELVGAPTPKDKRLDGFSFADVVRKGDNSGRPGPIFWHFPAYLQLGERGGRYAFRASPAGAIRAGRWKLIESFEDGHLELYDLDTDQSETTNLALQQPHIASRLTAALRLWRTQVKARMPLGLNPAFDAARGPLPRGRPITLENIEAKVSSLSEFPAVRIATPE